MKYWRYDNPPEPGWYHASVCEDPRMYRWWNGKNWSGVAYRHFSAKLAEHVASIPAISGPIYWKTIKKRSKK